MSKDTLTFALEGEVTLASFASVLSSFNDLLIHLSKEVGGDAAIDWMVEELYAGSAVATFHGLYEDLKVVESVVDAYETVGEALSSGYDIPYSEPVRRSVGNITDVLNGKITSIRFETSAREFIVSSKSLAGVKAPPMKYSRGTVKGVIQTLSMRKKLSFTLWDALFDRPVNCYLKEGEQERMRSAWGKRAVVSGRIGRQAETGRPIVVREVKTIHILEEVEPGSYRRARGVLPWKEGDEKPEDALSCFF
jgi:hypothetical protein